MLDNFMNYSENFSVLVRNIKEGCVWDALDKASLTLPWGIFMTL